MNYEILQRCGEAFNGPFRDHMMGHPANFRFFFVFFLGAIFFALLIKFLVAYLVYKDATAKNIENRKIWFFLVFVTSILGALFYFLMVIYQHKNNVPVTTQSPAQTTTQSSANNNTNPHIVGQKICVNCGNAGDGKFCSVCGQQF